MRRHWAEVGADRDSVEFELDVPLFRLLDARGQLQVLIARDGGAIVGYTIVVLRKHTHYKLFCGFEDAFFLAPEARNGLAGVKLIKETVKALRLRGVQKVFFHSKTVKPLGKIFERLGFTKSDEIYSLKLEN